MPQSFGVSMGGVNDVLQIVVGRGFVNASNFGKSSTKVTYSYILTPQGGDEEAFPAIAFLSPKLEGCEVLG